jgi:hypothetical protein
MGTATDPKTLYDKDFYAWTQEQARVLRQAAADRLNVPLDLENLAEEVEGMGRAERRAVESALACIVEHLLKLEFSPAADPVQGWRRTIRRERRKLERLLEENPSLATQERLEAALKKAWPDAADEAAGSMEDYGEAAAVATMPTECPYGLEQIRDVKWFPLDRYGVED